MFRAYGLRCCDLASDHDDWGRGLARLVPSTVVQGAEGFGGLGFGLNSVVPGGTSVFVTDSHQRAFGVLVSREFS